MTAIDLKPSEAFDEPLARPEPIYYKYLSADSEVLFAKLRYEPKRFSIKHPVNGSGWEDGIAEGTPRVIYNLPQVKAAVAAGDPIWIVEGEKDCLRLAELGETATCNFEGASIGRTKWKSEYTEMLRGATSVNIVADRDDPGVAHARAIADSLKHAVGGIRILQSATTGHGDDVSDHLSAGFGLDELIPLREENEITRQYVPVNWAVAFKSQPEDVQWLVPDFIEEGTLNAIYSAPGVGKSLLALEVAVEIVRSGKTCLYVDQENRIADTVERLTSFGVRPEELDRLLLYSFPALPPLDTADGGKHLVGLAEASECSLIILDTLSRMVEGGENESDTYLSLYRNSLAPLKGRGIATLRLDHSGKNEKLGQRGSSSKNGDCDTIFHLQRDDGENNFSLECEKSRSGHIPHGQLINLTREYDPLRHAWNVRVDIPLSRFEGIMRQMDNVGIPTSYGRDRVRKILKDHNVSGVRNDLLGAAITERRNRERRRSSLSSGTAGDDGTNERPF
jgi:hypothetical protein